MIVYVAQRNVWPMQHVITIFKKLEKCVHFYREK